MEEFGGGGCKKLFVSYKMFIKLVRELKKLHGSLSF